MDKLKILVIEDDKLAQSVMARHLLGHEIDFAGDKASAEKKLNSGGYNLCFVDLKLGKDDDCSGLKLLPVAKKCGVYAVVMSSSDDEETVNRAHALGCCDFYVKGNEAENIAAIITKYIQTTTLKGSVDIFTGQFITEDAQTREVVREALKYAPIDIPILILGPSGTGKTCLAKILHDHSWREGEFVAINCSAYTEELLEAELFGYKKGAFTGAYENRKGKLSQADKGTLFLDEIGAMSVNMQTKLLKAIEERTFYPVGSDRPEHSDFRIISATLEDLQQLLEQQKLRFDFFQRIHGFTVKLKPLSQRKCDILPLVAAFTLGRKQLSFEQDAKTFLLNHSWPGNIRELKTFVELVSATDGMVTLDTVQRHIAQTIRAEQRQSAKDGFLTDEQYDYAVAKGLCEALDRTAYEAIKRSLRENRNKRVKTRAQMKISARMLYSSLRKFGGGNGRKY
ncbi:MAG: sigma-54 dependent transcriptional regulator [Elusimicrobiales bacterium]|nr:sigma-54 dependent transcriptional regulator [Elusimicrobiales bacterium]